MRTTATFSAVALFLGLAGAAHAQKQQPTTPPPPKQPPAQPQAQQPAPPPAPQPPPQPYPPQPYPQQYPQGYPQQPYPYPQPQPQPYPQQPQPYPQQQPQPYPQQQPQPYPQQQPYPYPYPQQPQPQPYPYPPGQYPPQASGAYPSGPAYQMPDEPAEIRRRGFVLGFGIGGGGLNVDGEGNGGFAFSLGVGGMLNRHVALLFDYSAIARSVDGVTDESYSSFGGAAQVFLARILWLKAGLGLGRWTWSNDYEGWVDPSELSTALTLAAGVEVLQTTSGFALDLQGRFTVSRFNRPGTDDKIPVSQGSILLGFNFY